MCRVISGHLGWVRCVAVEPGNEWFATGAADRVIKIWDLASGRLKLSLTGGLKFLSTRESRNSLQNKIIIMIYIKEISTKFTEYIYL